MPRFLSAISVTFLFLPLAGCGSDRVATYRAGGFVKMRDGTPVAGARIEFQSSADRRAPTARARAAGDGSFQLGTFEKDDGAVLGGHKVIVLPPLREVPTDWEDRIGQGGADLPTSAGPQVDRRYRSFDTSGLTFTVTDDAEKNRFEIVLDGS